MWLSIHLTQLPLDLLTRGTGTDSTPLVISDGQGTRANVYLCNAAAQRAGIVPGIGLSAAYALAPGLLVHPRQPQHEQRALRQIAAWASQYSSMVSLVPPHALVMEIGGSLELFNGPQQLHGQIRSGMEALGYHAHISVASTPLAALWLARAGRNACCVQAPRPSTHVDAPERASGSPTASAHSHLAPLPLHVLDVDTQTLQALYELGLRTLGDCWQLPEAGLRERFGPELCAQFARALGRQADPRRAYKAPEQFSTTVLLAADIDNSEALLFPLRRLFLELEGFLLARQAGIQRFRLTLHHQRAPATAIAIELHKTGRDSRHWLDIAREKLSRVKLRAPVNELVLSANAWTALAPRNQDWVSGANSESADCSALIARLEARLGEDCVHSLAMVPEHRPEKAWRLMDTGQKSIAAHSLALTNMRDPHPARPLWLLPEPLPLKTVASRPWFAGKLQLKTGPERIESGWWDGDDVTRDYFIAANPDGEHLWIFREHLQPDRWFLHGMFG